MCLKFYRTLTCVSISIGGVICMTRTQARRSTVMVMSVNWTVVYYLFHLWRADYWIMLPSKQVKLILLSTKRAQNLIITLTVIWHIALYKIERKAKIRNRYNQVPHLTRNTITSQTRTVTLWHRAPNNALPFKKVNIVHRSLSLWPIIRVLVPTKAKG